jgi:hypothetical protein
MPRLSQDTTNRSNRVIQTQSFYKQVVLVSSKYLGPAGDRFVTRHISHHLQKQPSELQKSDLPELIDWIRLAMSFITNEQRMVDNYIADLRALAGDSHVHARASSIARRYVHHATGTQTK